MELRPLQDLSRLADAPDDHEQSYVIGGEYNGATYLLDSSMLLSAGRADDLAAIATRTGEVLVGCGAETASGSYWFSAFSGARLLRLYWMCHSELTDPYSSGEPLRSEASHPLDGDLDGVGILAALHELGFDYDAWSDRGPFQLFVVERIEDPKDQPLEGSIRTHCERHQIPPNERPEIVVVARQAPGSGPWAALRQWVRRIF